MPERTLRDCRILVAEDEYMLAAELRYELAEAGAIVIGPAPTVVAATALVEAETHLDGAILDLNLGGEMVYPLAELLIERDVSLIFTTGYDATAIPDRFRSIVRCEKPIDLRKVTQAIGRVVHGSA